MKQNKHINGDKANLLLTIIHPQRKVVDWLVENSWLVAVLDSGLRVKIKNT